MYRTKLYSKLYLNTFVLFQGFQGPRRCMLSCSHRDSLQLGKEEFSFAGFPNHMSECRSLEEI